jgi:hypothetical protein
LTIVKRRFALWPHTEQEKGRRPRCFCWCLSTVSMCTTVVSETDPTDNTWSPIHARMKRKCRWKGGSNTQGGGKGERTVAVRTGQEARGETQSSGTIAVHTAAP